MERKECGVIGAGLAGLAAAYHLTQKRWKVTVVEATRRLGGRVMTRRFKRALGLVCELGGEWIGSDHREMQRLCCAFNLELQPHQYVNLFWNQEKRARLMAASEWCMSDKLRAIWKEFEAEFRKFKLPEMRQLDKLDWWISSRSSVSTERIF
jgi:monoamine oxidase